MASDIGIDQLYLAPNTFSTQTHIDNIASWTAQNLMQLNPAKCNYMIFSQSDIDCATRLSINEMKLEEVQETKLLGVYIDQNLSWARNCKEITTRAYTRLSMLTKLKYAGVATEDLLDVYKLFIRSCAEYCSVAFHSSLTQEQSNKIERIQRTCLRVILGEMYLYISYSSALEMGALQTFFDRRDKTCLDFSLRCLKNKRTSRRFPLNPTNTMGVRTHEKFLVNFGQTTT